MPSENTASLENPMQAFWNERFADKEYAYGTEPNTFFRTELANLHPGRIFLPGEGEGRNAVHAAQMGWQADALDWSESGRQKALKLAAKKGVTINYQVALFHENLVRPERYDACGVIFFHLEPGLMKAAIATLLRGLKPGGHLIAELYEKKQLQYGTGGPRSSDLLYTKDQLRSWVDEGGGPAVTILKLHEQEIDLSEGSYHSGRSAVLRLVVRK